MRQRQPGGKAGEGGSATCSSCPLHSRDSTCSTNGTGGSAFSLYFSICSSNYFTTSQYLTGTHQRTSSRRDTTYHTEARDREPTGLPTRRDSVRAQESLVTPWRLEPVLFGRRDDSEMTLPRIQPLRTSQGERSFFTHLLYSRNLLSFHLTRETGLQKNPPLRTNPNETIGLVSVSRNTSLSS